MSRENVETARTIYPGPLDLTAIFASPEALDAARAQLESFVEPDFETVHDPAAVGLAIGASSGEGVSEGIDGFIAICATFFLLGARGSSRRPVSST